MRAAGVLVAVLGLAALPGGPAGAGEGALVVMEDTDGNLLVASLPPGDHAAFCGAPLPCTTGPHDASVAFFHGFVMGPLRSGTYTSVLSGGADRTRTFTCVNTPVGTIACQGVGNWPVKVPFTHACAFGALDGGCILYHFNP